MANNFSGDNNCKAVWNFESGALTTDSKGSNTLTDNNTVGTNTTDYKQGSACADFENANNESLSITDANLDSGFPFKSGDTNKKGSFCCWVKPESHTQIAYVWSKYDINDNDRSIALTLQADGTFALNQGYNSGASYEPVNHAGVVTDGRWYHVAVTYDGSDDSYRIRVWDDYNNQELASDQTGTCGNAIWVDDAPWVIGNRGDFDTSRDFDGLIDEVVVFDDILTVSEIDQIRAGTYSVGGTTLAVADLASAGDLDAPTLTQKHNLAVGDLVSSNSLDAVVLAQKHNLSVAGLTSGTNVDAIDLIADITLAVNDLISAGVIESPALVQKHTLAIDDIACASAVETITLNLSTLLAVADALSAGSLDALTLTQAHNLAVDDLTSAGILYQPSITQAHQLAVDDLTSQGSAESITLSLATLLAVADAISTAAVDNIDLTQKHVLTVYDLASSGILDAVGLTQRHLLDVADLLSAASIDTINFNLPAGTVTISVSASRPGTTVSTSGPGVTLQVKKPSITIQ